MSNSLTGPDPLLALATTQVSAAPAITKPEPTVILPDTVGYVCTIPHASIHRKDGTRIGFTAGFLETAVEATIKFLDEEIRGGHAYIRRATAEEINAAHMRLDPRGTMRAEIEREFAAKEIDLRARLEREIRAQLGMPVSEEVKEVITELEAEIKPEVDAGKLAGTEIAAKLAKLRTRVTGATLTPVSTKLSGIVSTADLNGNAAGSASIGGDAGGATGSAAS